MIVEYIINGIMILVGILLCCRGLRFYKAFQMFLCGALGGYIGLFIQQRFNNEWLIFLAIALFALGMILGYKYPLYGATIKLFGQQLGKCDVNELRKSISWISPFLKNLSIQK